MSTAALKYKHRVGVRAEICFDIESETQTLTKENLRAKILAVIGSSHDEDEGFDLPEPLVAGRAYVAWQSLTGNSYDPGTTNGLQAVAVLRKEAFHSCTIAIGLAWNK